MDAKVGELPPAAGGRFVAQMPAPRRLGTIALEGGSAVEEFHCAAIAVRAMTGCGGWRTFPASLP